MLKHSIKGSGWHYRRHVSVKWMYLHMYLWRIKQHSVEARIGNEFGEMKWNGMKNKEMK